MFRKYEFRQGAYKEGGSMGVLATLTYYQLKKPQDFLAVARFSMKLDDRNDQRVFERRYEDNPDAFCELERMVEGSLRLGIDVTIMSAYEHEVFPSISAFLD